MSRAIRWAIAASALVLSTVTFAGPKQPSPSANPDKISAPEVGAPALSAPTWRQLTFEASKLFISMKTRVDLTTEIQPPSHLLAPNKQILDGRKLLAPEIASHRLTLETSVLGRRSLETVHFDGTDGQAVQRHKRRFGSKSYSKTHRFLDRGVLLRRLSPEEGAGSSEEKDWTRRQDTLYPGPNPASCTAVIDPIEIFYLISTADLHLPGDRFETCVFSKKSFARLTVEVVAITDREVHYRVDSDAPKKRRASTLALVIRTAPLSGQEPSEAIELIGLEGDLEIFLDRQHRVPVEICGDHSKMGSISIRLTDVTTAESSS